MVGCRYSGGKPRHWVMIREVVSLDMCGRWDKGGIRGMKSGTMGPIVN